MREILWTSTQDRSIDVATWADESGVVLQIDGETKLAATLTEPQARELAWTLTSLADDLAKAARP